MSEVEYISYTDPSGWDDCPYCGALVSPDVMSFHLRHCEGLAKSWVEDIQARQHKGELLK